MTFYFKSLSETMFGTFKGSVQHLEKKAIFILFKKREKNLFFFFCPTTQVITSLLIYHDKQRQKDTKVEN